MWIAARLFKTHTYCMIIWLKVNQVPMLDETWKLGRYEGIGFNIPAQKVQEINAPWRPICVIY